MCDSTDIYAEGPEHIEDNLITEYRECNHCNSRWVDEFTFSGVSFPDYHDSDDPLFI